MRGLNNVEFRKADLFQLPFPDNHFDLVFENGVIEHFKNYPEALLEMKRVVKKGGKIIVVFPNIYNDLNLATAVLIILFGGAAYLANRYKLQLEGSQKRLPIGISNARS